MGRLGGGARGGAGWGQTLLSWTAVTAPSRTPTLLTVTSSAKRVQPHHLRAALLWTLLALLFPTGVRTLNVDRVNGQRADGIHYEYHVYSVSRVFFSSAQVHDALVDPVMRRAPSGEHPFSNLTIFSAAEEQVVREFIQPIWAWLPLVTGADGQPKWLTYDEASGAVVETKATYVSNNTAPLSGGRLVMGGCLDQNGQWFHPDNGKGGIVLKHRVRERGTFRHGDSYYNIEQRRSNFIVTHATAGQREFLSYPGKVASIETAEENAFLASVLREAGIEAAWIGAVRERHKEVNNTFPWAWGTQSDGTRSARVFGASPHADECRLKGGVTFVPGVYHNFKDAFEPCGDASAGVVLRADGSWSTTVNLFDRFPTITEFATSRNLSGEVAYRDKVFRVEALDETEVAARATAEQSRYGFLPNVTLTGHLPVPDSFGEVLLLTQLAVAARPSVCTSAALIRRATRAFLGFDFSANEFVFTAAYGPNQGLRVGIAPNNSYVPQSVLDLDAIFERCIAAEGPGYRFGLCNSPKGVTIAEFNLNGVDGRFYIPLGFTASAFGLQQLVGSRRGALIAHVPAVRTEAQLLVFNSTVARGGFGDAFVNSVSRVANTPFRWPDGQLVGANLSIVPGLDLVAGTGARCLRVHPINDPQLPSKLWVSATCTDYFSPLILEYSREPVRPEELGVLSASEGCTLTPPLFQCVGRGLTRIPQVSNPGSYNAILLSTNHLSRVDSSGFLLPNLLDARMFANEITSVDDDAFVGCPKLQSLDLSLNSLTEMPRLDYLTALTTLTLENNNIQLIRPGVLPLSLESLVLSLNAITEIPAGAFAGLSSLTLLSLNSNPIGAVHISGFAPVNQASVFMSNTPCACSVSAGVLVQCAPDCQVFGNTTTTASPAFQTAAAERSSSSSSGAIIGAVVAALVIVALLVLLVLWRRRAARSTKVQVDPRGAWSDDASSSALCAGDMSSFAVAEEEAVTALMGARISQDSLELGQPLGSGAFGEVFRGRGRSGRIAGMEVAVKTLATTERDARDVFMKEASLQLELQHPHIVTLLGVCMNPGRGPMIVMELMPRGDLRQHLVKETASGRAPETAALTSWCEQVCSAMAYLETKRILHRDIAARNVLLSGELVAKLADLGLARTLSGKDYYRKLSDDRVPLKWMAPESIVDKVYVIRSDVWSFGVLLFETFSLGGKPYPNMTAAETVKFVLGGNRLPAPFGMPEEIARLMQHCWQHEPYARPSFAELHASLQSTLASNEEESVL